MIRWEWKSGFWRSLFWGMVLGNVIGGLVGVAMWVGWQ